MKNSSVFYLLLVIFFSDCNAQQDNTNSSLEIEYNARTRGSFITIYLKENSLIYKSPKEEKSISLKEKDIQEVEREISKINLFEINDLKAPSEKRFTDGALSANFNIKKNGVTYISSDFDHENPPKELKDLYTILIIIYKKG